MKHWKLEDIHNKVFVAALVSGTEIFLEEIVRPGLREGPESENGCA